MAGFSNTLEQQYQEHLFKKTAPTAVTNLWISLHSADPADTGANELSGGSYARVQLDPDTNNSTNTNWNAIGAGAGNAQRISNKLAITFPTATANWTTATHAGLWSAVTGGTFYGTLTIAVGGQTVLNGGTLSFPGGTPGTLAFDLD